MDIDVNTNHPRNHKRAKILILSSSVTTSIHQSVIGDTTVVVNQRSLSVGITKSLETHQQQASKVTELHQVNTVTKQPSP